MNWQNQIILLTGGTGSFGQAFTKLILSKSPKSLRVFDCDEYSQFEVSNNLKKKNVSYLLGRVEDKDRLYRAMQGVDMVVHAAALKQVPIIEYNPFEAVKTNILGSQNIIDCAIDLGVKKTILISSDKAVSPTNLYGATKMVAEKIFVQANSYAGDKNIRFSVVRYGNVMASRGSVVPTFLEQKKNDTLTITDERMTRFWITLDEGVKFVLSCIETMRGGEIFVPKIPSIKIIELARAVAPKAKIKIVGIRAGEKLHELLVSEDEARHAKDFNNYFVIEPEFISWGKTNYNNNVSGKELEEGFRYSSDNNNDWLSPSDIKKLLKQLTENNA